MTSHRDIDRLLDHWFTERPTEVPDRVIDDVATRIARQPQRAAWRLPSWRFPSMSTPFRLAAVGAALLLVLLGGAIFTRGGAGPVPAPSETPSPSLTATPSPVGVAGACDLMTPDEARNSLHLASPVVALSLTHLDMNAVTLYASGFCGFQAGPTPLFVLRYEPESGGNAFAYWKKVTGVQAVPGLGDQAVWDPAKGTLYILKGQRLVSILPLEGPTTTLTLEAAKAIGAIVVTRM